MRWRFPSNTQLERMPKGTTLSLTETHAVASRGVKLLLFGSSYTPLWVIFALLYWAQGKPREAVGWVLLSVACVVTLWYFFKVRVPSRASFTATVSSIQRRDADTLSYVATYLIPFVTVPMSDKWQVTAALFFLIAVLAVVYISSNMIAINPLLTIMQYHLYEVSVVGHTSSCLLLSAPRVEAGKEIRLADVSEGVYLRV